MTLLWRLRIAVLLVVVLALGAYGMSERDPALALAIVFAAMVGWWFTEGKPGRGLPRWLTNLVLIGIVVGAAWRVTTGGVLVSAFTGFLATLVIAKAWEKRRTQDYGQLLTMSLFLLVGATLTDNTLVVGLAVLAFLPVFAVAVMLYQLFAPAGRASPTGVGAVGGAGGVGGADAGSEDAVAVALTRDLNLTRGGWARLYAVAGMAVVGASVIAGVVFVFVPRGVGLGRMGDFGRAVTGRTTGFSDRVELGQGGLISQSQERVMEVKIGYRGSSVGTEGAVRYLRGAVLERYSGGVWTKVDPFERPSERRRVDMTESEQFIRAPEYEFAIKQEVTLFGAGAGETPLFAVYKPHSLAFQEYGAMEVAFDATAATLTRRGPAGRLRYSIDSYPDRADRAAVSSRRMAAYLASREQVGFPSEAIRAMAAQVLIERQIEPDPAKRPAEEDLAAARALRAHVERHATYTLDILAAPQGQDPTEWFLFQVRKGHCEYFASALAALCRSVGIDARVVTGFVAGEFDRQGEVYVVRAANAHAWVEARVGADHWITLDGTPASEIERISSPTGTFGGRFWRWLDGVESVWASSVVSFDTRAQQQLLGRGMKSPWLDSALEWTRERLDGGGGGGGGGLRVDFGRLGTGLALLVGGGAIVWVALRRRGPRAAGWRGVGMDAEAQVVHGALLAALARRGHPKPSHAPLRAHAAGIEDATLSREAVAIADRLYAAVFGGRALDAGESREWARRARALEREG